MENTDIPIEHEEQVPEESKKMIDQVTDDVSKKVAEINDEIQTIENKNDDEVVPSTTPKQMEEQENVTEINPNMSASVSPGRANVPFKEVNESDKEENASLVNGTENMISKKRELDIDDEQIQEKILENDDRTDEPTKKLKISDPTDIPTVETKESENNLIVNGTPATVTEV